MKKLLLLLCLLSMTMVVGCTIKHGDSKETSYTLESINPRN